MAKRPKKEVLPKAPMVEVVFEVRWKLQSGPQGEVVFQSDPGLVMLLDRFSKRMRQVGFPSQRDMSHPLQTGPHGVVRRFFRAPDRPFPIQQIGPGIFASNEGPEYDWKPFKNQALKGLRALLDSYPQLDSFPLTLTYLELRYIDVFKPSLVDAKSGLFDFVRKGMNANIELPPMFEDQHKFHGRSEGRLLFRRKLKEHESSHLVIDVGTGIRNFPNEPVEDIIRMETKVFTEGEGIPNERSRAKVAAGLGKWLDFAHGILSPAFKELVRKDVRQKYGLAD